MKTRKPAKEQSENKDQGAFGLHDPDERGIWCFTGDEDVYLEFTDDPLAAEEGTGISRHDAEIQLELQEQPIWQPSTYSPEEIERLTNPGP